MKNKMYNKIQITYCSGVGKGIVKEGLIFFSSRVWYWVF